MLVCRQPQAQLPRRNSKAVSGVSGACSASFFMRLSARFFAVLALGWLNAALRAWTRDVARWLVGIAVAVGSIISVFRHNIVPQGPPDVAPDFSRRFWLCPIAAATHRAPKNVRRQNQICNSRRTQRENLLLSAAFR